MNRMGVDAVVGHNDSHTLVQTPKLGSVCTALGHFLIAWIRRVYYTMYYMPHVRTYARAYKLTACYDTDRPGFPMKFHRRNSGGLSRR